MPLKLNKVADEKIVDMLALDLERLKGNMSEPPPDNAKPAELEAYYEAIGDLSRDIGLMLYQQEKERHEILYHLRLAGGSLLHKYELRARIEQEESDGDPRDFEETLNLVATFGSANERRRASRIQKRPYSEPGESNQKWLGNYLELLKEYLAGGTPDKDAALEIEEYCKSNVASREHQWFLLPKTAGLWALAEGVRAAWRNAISQLLKAHEWEALRGKYRRLPGGFICFPALMLARLGREHEFVCDIASPYLPTNLLES